MNVFAVICVLLVVGAAAYFIVNRRKIKRDGLKDTVEKTVEDLRERL